MLSRLGIKAFQLLTEYYLTKHLQLLGFQSLMDINADSPLCLQIYFGKKSKNTTTQRGTKTTSQNHQLADQLHIPITKKFKKHKIYSSYRENISDATNKKMQQRSLIQKLGTKTDLFGYF